MSRHLVQFVGCMLISIAGFASFAAADDFVPFVIPADVNPKSPIALPPGPAIKPDGQRITIKDDKFYVGQERFKVWGVNMCFAANFPTHKDAERVAARLAASGVNSVRFHHMDSANYPAGLWDPREKNKLHLEALERLDYFIDQLARKGIYANINLHVGREHSKTLGLPDGNETQNKMIDIFTPQLIEAQKQYARDLLGHVNQYRQVRYADDAAVGFVEINNEDSLFMWSAPTKLPKLPEYYARLLREKYVAWLKHKYGTTEKLAIAWNKDAVPLGPNILPKEMTLAAGGKPGWALEQHGGTQAAIKPLKDDKHSGVRVEIGKSDNEIWHIQFNHPGLAVVGSKPHTVSFQARSDSPRSIGYNVGMAHEPWGSLGLNATADLTNEWKTFPAGFTSSADDSNGRLNFQLSGNPASVEIAEVTFQVGGGQGLADSESIESGNVAVFSNSEPQPRQYDRMRFLAETERAFFADMRQYLKKELGCKAVMTGTIVFGPLGLWAQQDMDYIDAHAYWQHPHFPGRPWDPDNWTIEQKAMVDSPEKSTLPTLAASRLASKPFTVSEYNHPAPNDYQAECIPMLAACGAAQDWDGVWFFAYSHNQDWDKPYFDSFFDLRANPAKWGFMVAGKRLFQGRPDTKRVHLSLVKDGDPFEQIARLHQRHGLNMFAALSEVTKVDAETTLSNAVDIELNEKSSPDLVAPWPWEFNVQKHGTMRKYTGSGFAFVGWPFGNDKDLSLCMIGIKPAESRFLVACDCALDDDYHRGSPNKYLLTVCGRAENAEMKFSADRRTVGRNWGTGPTRIEAISGRFAAAPEGRWKCQALGPDGMPTADVPIEESKEHPARVIQLSPKYGTMWYLFTRE